MPFLDIGDAGASLVVPRGSGDLSMRQDEVVIIILRAIRRGQGPKHWKANVGAACVQGRRCCHRAVVVFWSCSMLWEHPHLGRRDLQDPLIALVAILCTVAAESCHNVRDPTAPLQAVEETTHTTRILEEVVKVLVHSNGVAICRALVPGLRRGAKGAWRAVYNVRGGRTKT